MKFTKRFRYRFGDIDDAGIAYYPSFFHYFHCAFEDWWSDGLGYPYPGVLQQDKLGLPAVKLEVEFFAPIRYGDEPWVHLGILKIGRSSVEFAYWMTLGDDDEPACRARVITAAVDMDTMQGQPLPEVWRERFAPFIHETVDLFGPGRCMFASNVPPDALSQPFDAIYAAFYAWAERYTLAERRALFHDTAARVYRL